jgi:RHS repeat-associated protein
MTWDAESRLATDNGTTYIYDAEGNRVEKQGSGIADTIYFGGEPIARYSGGQWTDLIYGPSGLLAEIPGTQAGAPVYRVTDNLGTNVGSLLANGSFVDPIDHTPFGQVITGDTSAPYLFTGKERDNESGLDYFGARYYASSMGRWMSPDWSAKAEPVPYAKLDDPQSLNLYAYVHNNPVVKSDPDGHFEWQWHVAITFVAGLATGHGVVGSAKLALQTANVDFRKGSQHTDAAHTNMHAMEGIKPDKTLQTPTEARQGTRDTVANAMKNGDTPEALRAVQDLAVPLHDGHAWTGINGSFVKHFIGDNLPAPSNRRKCLQQFSASAAGK